MRIKIIQGRVYARRCAASDGAAGRRAACYGGDGCRWMPALLALAMYAAGWVTVGWAMADEPADKPAGSERSTPTVVREVDGVQQADVVREINSSMREIGQRLLHGQVSASTQQKQDQVVDQLDTLIRQLGQAAAGQSSAAAAGRSPKKAAGNSPQAGGQKAARDTEAVGSQSPSTLSVSTLEREMGQAWGQLPERMRRQMQDASAIEFLPQFRQLIEDYYRRLAEDRR